MKNIRVVFIWKFSVFLEVKFSSIYLNRRVFVMNTTHPLILKYIQEHSVHSAKHQRDICKDIVYMVLYLNTIIGIKHGFSCINIRQVPREVLKTEAEGRGFQHLPRDLANVNALKTMFDRYYCIKNLKTFATFRVISCTILLRLFTDISRTQCARTMLVLGPGSTHLVTAANLWPRYDHIESCVAVH